MRQLLDGGICLLAFITMFLTVIEASCQLIRTISQFNGNINTLLQSYYSSLDFVQDCLMSQYQKGKTKTNVDFLQQKTMSTSGMSWANEPYANMHLT